MIIEKRILLYLKYIRIHTPYVETQKKFTWVSLVKQNDYDRRNKGSKYQSWESG